MRKKIIIFLSLIIVASFGIAEATTGNGLEQRVTQLEALLTPTIASQTTPFAFAAFSQPSEFPNCTFMDIGIAEQPNFVVRNWCPESHEYVYYIQDVRAIENSLVLANVQRDGIEDAPSCYVRDTGTLPFPTGSLITTGFILQCVNTSNVPVAGDKLIYTVLSATSVT